MKAIETTSSFVLPDRRIAVAGDWHGDAGWVKTALRALSRIAPDITTVLHVGDASARAGGRADILITHESPAGTPVEAVKRILRTNPMGFPKASLVESAASRVRVARVSEAIQPSIHVHGHMHAPGAGVSEGGRRVISLGCNGQQSNLAVVDLADLSIDVPSLREIRGETQRVTGRP